jgi:hypothetical protein
VSLEVSALAEAIAVAFTSRGFRAEEARAVLAASAWWGSKGSRRRWDEFCRQSPGLEIPGELGEVVAQVAERLRPALNLLPH